MTLYVSVKLSYHANIFSQAALQKKNAFVTNYTCGTDVIYQSSTVLHAHRSNKYSPNFDSRNFKTDEFPLTCMKSAFFTTRYLKYDIFNG